MAPAISAEATPGSTREAIFVYGDQKNLPSRLTLNLAGDPVLFPSGYVRLVGVVGGEKPTVCFDVGGRGLVRQEGEAIDDHRIVGIAGDQIILEKI